MTNIIRFINIDKVGSTWKYCNSKKIFLLLLCEGVNNFPVVTGKAYIIFKLMIKITTKMGVALLVTFFNFAYIKPTLKPKK